MSVRIERIDKDGNRWVVSGSSQTELETGISALHKALDKNAEQVEDRRPGRPPKNGVPQNTQRQRVRIVKTLAILRAMNEAGRVGAFQTALANAAGIQDRKALGPLMGMVGRIVREMELPQRDVYVSRGFGHKKRWIPQARMPDAIKKLEEMEKSASL